MEHHTSLESVREFLLKLAVPRNLYPTNGYNTWTLSAFMYHFKAPKGFADPVINKLLRREIFARKREGSINTSHRIIGDACLLATFASRETQEILLKKTISFSLLPETDKLLRLLRRSLTKKEGLKLIKEGKELKEIMLSFMAKYCPGLVAQIEKSYPDDDNLPF